MREPESSEITFLTAMTNCTSLEYLFISSNPFGGTLPNLIGNLSSTLQWFSADHCEINGQIPREIGSLNVNFLELQDNNLQGTIPSTIGRMKSLQRLILNNNELNGPIPDEICSLKNLGDIYFSNNTLSGSIPRCIGNVSHLQQLWLDSNLLNSSIPLGLWSLENLLNLNLSSNSLDGTLDPNITPSRVLVYMDLSWNQISGQIPSTIGAFESLTTLNLNMNSFWGPIPGSIGNLIGLEHLDLSHNNLSGTIPKSLEALRHLEFLNLSSNKLSGEIPSNGPFKNLTMQSFLENAALCGQPYLQVPPCASHTVRKSWVKIVIGCSILIIALVAIFVVGFFIAKKYKRKNVQSPNFVSSLTPTEHRKFTYRELSHATNNFSEANTLGVGSFGSVYKGILSDGAIVAVKVINFIHEEAFKSFDVECKVLRTVRHKNLVKVISSCSNPEFRALILQYMSNGSLQKWLYSHNYCLDLLQRINILLDVALGLEYLHHGQSNAVVHCDLKPGNVLLDDDMVAHVSDFGITKILAENQEATQTKTLGTVGYIAPEYGSEGRVSTKGDIYSYGIMLLETFTRRKPTDEMFTEELTLREWVNISLPSESMEVVDRGLLETIDGNQMNDVEGYLLAIMKLGLECSAEVPDERSDIKDVIVQLNKIKAELRCNRRT